MKIKVSFSVSDCNLEIDPMSDICVKAKANELHEAIARCFLAVDPARIFGDLAKLVVYIAEFNDRPQLFVEEKVVAMYEAAREIIKTYDNVDRVMSPDNVNRVMSSGKM